GFLAFLLTPFVVHEDAFIGGLVILHFQTRLGGSYFLGLVILLICVICQLLGRVQLEPQENLNQFLSTLHRQLRLQRYLTLALVSSSFAIWMGILSGQTLAYQPPKGLPGWEKVILCSFPSISKEVLPLIKLSPPTNYEKKAQFIYESTKESNIYEWVHENIHNSRILNLDLPSYGLVNFPFSNEVIVPYRISEARDDYDYITVLLFHPHYGTHFDPERWKPFVKNPQMYRPVFRDHLVLVLAKQPPQNSSSVPSP
ncbi:hypothetical protein, partial [Thermosynechococcus sp.]|uniref:hypothetical protein n=1 Tax=Thermosynechococcus sp. TaxID=2814275 RepID=UPI00391B9AF3